MNFSFEVVSLGAFRSARKFRNFPLEIKWNGPFRFGPTGIFVTTFEGGPVHFDRSAGHFGRSVGQNCPFPFDKIVVPAVPLFCILLTRTITKRAVAWVGFVQPECAVPLGMWNFRNFKPEFLLKVKRPRFHSLVDICRSWKGCRSKTQRLPMNRLHFCRVFVVM